MICVINTKKTVEEALRKFKRKVKNARIIEEYTDKQYFLKPSIKKRLKSKRARALNHV